MGVPDTPLFIQSFSCEVADYAKDFLVITFTVVTFKNIMIKSSHAEVFYKIGVL